MSITVYGCVSSAGEITFENLASCLVQEACVVRTGEHAAQVALALSGANYVDCNDTFYGCINKTTGKFQVVIPEHCCGTCQQCSSRGCATPDKVSLSVATGDFNLCNENWCEEYGFCSRMVSLNLSDVATLNHGFSESYYGVPGVSDGCVPEWACVPGWCDEHQNNQYHSIPASGSCYWGRKTSNDNVILQYSFSPCEDEPFPEQSSVFILYIVSVGRVMIIAFFDFGGLHALPIFCANYDPKPGYCVQSSGINNSVSQCPPNPCYIGAVGGSVCVTEL